MYKETLRSAWVEVDLSNLDHNIEQLKKITGDTTEIIAVIKADAYGHGSVHVARHLKDHGICTFAVAALSEAILLRDNGFDDEIILLGITPDIYVDTIVDYNLTPVVCTLSNAEAINRAAAKAGKTVSALIAVDTGMGRIGYRPADEGAVEEIRQIADLEAITVRGIFSHFATADAADKTYALQQEEQFNGFCNKLEAVGIDTSFRTLANSAATMEMPSTHMSAVRAGIALYGCYPSDEVDKELLQMKPVMSVKANILHLKEIEPGETVSYGQTFRAERKSKIATIALGYADGFPRPYSSKGKVICNGHIVPLAGNICMDQCMIDVTDVPDVKAGDEVIIMGSDGNNTISADDIARETGTINYEIICAFGQRLPKVYI